MSRSEKNGIPAPSSRIEAWTQRTRAAIRTLPNVPFFLGIVLGFGGCVLAGRAVSQRLMLHDFVRFFQSIQPQHYFYPTASQLVAHVRMTVPPGKTPVLVGGASYFRGTGQNRGELWSVELQRLLGDRYVVINFAIDQAEITSFAAVAFKILAREYPDLIYVANGSPIAGFPWDGGDIYRYIFWDAYYKGLLPESAFDAKNIQTLAHDQRRERDGLELHLGKWLDARAYACDLWTWIGYNHFFTVWSDAHARSPFRARHFDRDGDYPNYAQDQRAIRNDKEYAEHNERHGRESSRAGFVAGADGQWRVDPAAWNRWAQEWRDMFVEELRPRCFVVLLRGNPHFAQALHEDERRRQELQLQLGAENLERVGFRPVQLRAEDFTADDFLDGGHLMPSGGRKVAMAVAQRIDEVKRAEQMRQTNRGPSGALEVAFSLPEDQSPRQEPLIVISPRGNRNTGENLFVEYLGGAHARFGYSQGASGETVYSPQIELAAGARHTLRASLPGLYPEAGLAGLSRAQLERLSSWFLLQLDDQPFWEIPLPARRAPAGELSIAHDPAAAPAHGAKFTGTIHSAEREQTAPKSLARDRLGGAKLRLTLTAAVIGRRMPLAVTGKAERGDVLSLRVDADRNIQFTYDHWAAPLVQSRKVPLGPGETHTIEFRLPALASDRTNGRGDLRVSIDGAEVWRVDVPFFPFEANDVFFGENPIGASTAEPRIEGAVFEGVLAPTWK